MDVNPIRFHPRPTKDATYRRTIDGKIIRIIPREKNTSFLLDVGWVGLTEMWRNMLHDWFSKEKKIALQTHLSSNPRDIWTVKIDEFSASYRKGYDQRWDIDLVLKVLDGTNDPILSQVNKKTVSPFVVSNNTNRVIHDALIFVQPLPSGDVVHSLDDVDFFIGISAHNPDARDWQRVGGERFVIDIPRRIMPIYGATHFGQMPYGAMPSASYPHILCSLNISKATNVSNIRLKLNGFGQGDYNGEPGYGLDIHAFNTSTKKYDLLINTGEGCKTDIDFSRQIYLDEPGNYIDKQSKKIYMLVKTTYPVGNTQNATIEIYDMQVAISYKALVMNPISITQTFLNLLQDPGFEGVELVNSPGTPYQWVDTLGNWSQDYIQYLEGSTSIRTSAPDSLLYQEVYAPEGKQLTAMCYAKADTIGSVGLKIDCLAYDGTLLESFNFSHDVLDEYEPVWFVTPETPIGTYKVRFSVSKTGGEGFVHVDQALLRLGASFDVPVWTNHKHQTLTYSGTLDEDDVLRINLGRRLVDINALENAYSQISGEFFSMPVGESMLLFSEETDVVSTRAVVRFDELWD